MERPEGAYDIPRPSSKIPIISWAQAGPGGYYEDAYVSGFGDINRPYDVNDQNAYALIISGDSMSPKFEPGDIVIVSPAAGVQTGDYAVIKLVDGQVLAKRVKAKNGRYVLESVNPDYGIIDCPAEEVLFMHRIVWVKQRG
jgi:phage repressor protein C with HTH and peptisase S24 domain